ncbi:MAG: recombinase zinc beta ribbon domain-containing protein [Phycisphaeraceae bacterium]
MDLLRDRKTFDRVQALLGGSNYRSHELTYAGELITCGHCGSPITGECKTKKTKSGEKHYRYYRCSKYNTPGHPRIRLREAELDQQVLDLFDKIKIDDPKVRDWFVRALQAKVRDGQKQTEKYSAEINRQLTSLRDQQNRLLNLRLMEEIDKNTFAEKNTELRDRIAQLSLQLEADDRNRAEQGEVALKVFELSQTLKDKWLTADYRAKRRILEIVCLNSFLRDVSLDMTLNKPFDVLAEGLESAENRGDRI